MKRFRFWYTDSSKKSGLFFVYHCSTLSFAQEMYNSDVSKDSVLFAFGEW